MGQDGRREERRRETPREEEKRRGAEQKALENGAEQRDLVAANQGDVLIDLSQEHALERVELSGHLLGEVLQVGGLNHLQALPSNQRHRSDQTQRALHLSTHKNT